MSFVLNLTYKLLQDESPLATSLRENDNTGERLEVAVSTDGPMINVVVRRTLSLTAPSADDCSPRLCFKYYRINHGNQ